jgi:vacuolar-type H+-ATPase subunit H
MTIEKILDEMETLLVEATRVPFTNKRILEEDDMAHLIDELHETLPGEIMEASRIMSERRRVLEEAQKEAQAIVDQAKSYVSRMTDESIITRQAQEQAAEIIQTANNSARDLQRDALQYAQEVFKHLEANLGCAMEVVQRGHNDLQTAIHNSTAEEE